MLAALAIAAPLAAQEPQRLHVGDRIAVNDACTAKGHALMTSPTTTASRKETMETLALLRAKRQCFRVAQADVEVLEIAEPVLVERLGQYLFGFRFHHLDRDLWSAHYETSTATR